MTNLRNFSTTATFLVLCCSILVSTVIAQTLRADIDHNRIETQVGNKDVTITCRFSKPIVSCRFIIPGVQGEIKLSDTFESRDPRFEYVGGGRQNGYCGIKIKNIEEEFHGSGMCLLDPDEGTDAIANFDIVISRAPEDPRIAIIDPVGQRLDTDKPITAECVAEDARPPAKLMWFLDDKEIGPGVVEEHDTQREGSAISSFTTVSKLRYKLKPEDNGAKLICRAEHIAYGTDKYQSTSYNLDVYYRPQPRDKIVFGGLETGKTAIVGPITIMANPRPNEIKWTIDGSTVIRAPTNTPKYVATHPVPTNGGWNVTLQIIELSLEDFGRSYRLQVSNDYGITDYTVKIQASPDINGSGLGTVPIVFIVIISILVLVAVVLVAVAKVTKRWCFAGDSMHPNSPDSEAQIAPDDDKLHEPYEQHEKSADESDHHEENGNQIKPTNGNGTKNNTSV